MGQALFALEASGAYHGDLHDKNILVDQFSADGLRLKVVDISFDAVGSLPAEVYKNTDLLSFKQLLWRLLTAQKSALPNMSLRKYIGTRNYLKIIAILDDATDSFERVSHVLESDGAYNAYLELKASFIQDRFLRPESFRLQRYEEIIDQTVAVRLFVPFEQLMTKIIGFGNMFVSGNGGSGKSTYLASLAFFPQAEESIVEFTQIFGVYFPCRQGEFQPLGSHSAAFQQTEVPRIASLLTLKIGNRGRTPGGQVCALRSLTRSGRKGTSVSAALSLAPR